jgi:hypothetical protein
MKTPYEKMTLMLHPKHPRRRTYEAHRLECPVRAIILSVRNCFRTDFVHISLAQPLSAVRPFWTFFF